jgi:hypothetical protein
MSVVPNSYWTVSRGRATRQQSCRSCRGIIASGEPFICRDGRKIRLWYHSSCFNGSDDPRTQMDSSSHDPRFVHSIASTAPTTKGRGKWSVSAYGAQDGTIVQFVPHTKTTTISHPNERKSSLPPSIDVALNDRSLHSTRGGEGGVALSPLSRALPLRQAPISPSNSNINGIGSVSNRVLSSSLMVTSPSRDVRRVHQRSAVAASLPGSSSVAARPVFGDYSHNNGGVALSPTSPTVPTSIASVSSRRSTFARTGSVTSTHAHNNLTRDRGGNTVNDAVARGANVGRRSSARL